MYNWQRALACVALLLATAACQGNTDAPAAVLRADGYRVEVGISPLQLRVVDEERGQVVTALRADAMGTAQWFGADLRIYEGYSFRLGTQALWRSVQHATLQRASATRAVVHLHIDDATAPATHALEVELHALQHASPRCPPDAAAATPPSPLLSCEHPLRYVTARMFPLRPLPPSKLGRPVVWLSLDAPVGEGRFGFGERFNAAEQSGGYVECWCEDGGWGLGTELRLPKGATSTYAPMPLYLSPRGHGVWLNTTSRSAFDMRWPGVTTAHVEADSVQLVVLLGRQPAEALRAFTALTGRSLMPPPQQFGPWDQLGHAFPDVRDPVQAAQRLVDTDTPSSAAIESVHFFPMGAEQGQEAQLRKRFRALAALGLPSLVYFNSMVDQRYTQAYEHLLANGMFVRWADNSTFTFSYKGAGPNPFPVALIDVTNPRSVAWFQQQMQRAVDMGAAGWMYDYGEYVDPDTLFHDGRSGREMHNAYPVEYQRAAFEFFARSLPPPAAPPSRWGLGAAEQAPPFIFYVRSGYVGTGGVTWAHWTGDPSCDWSRHSGLASQITSSLTIGMGGVPFSGSDIGGFVWLRPPTPELWIRWAQLGAVSGHMHMQTGGTSLLGADKSTIQDTPLGSALWRRYAKLRTALYPYLRGAAAEAVRSGMPLMRHHLLSFPRDPQALRQEYQFMLGGTLLAAPVVEQGATKQRVYLPAGERGEVWWADVMSHAVFEEADGLWRIGRAELVPGGQHREVAAPLTHLPLWARAGSIIPTLLPDVHSLAPAPADRAAGVVFLADRAHTRVLWVFPDATGAAAGVEADGIIYAARADRQAGEVIVTAQQVAGAPTPAERAPGFELAVPVQWLVVQWAGADVQSVAQSGSDVPACPSWRQVLSSTQPCWARDPEQGTTWLRLQGPGATGAAGTASATLRLL